MSHQVIKQPDGLFAVFSTVADAFVVTDATAAEIVEHLEGPQITSVRQAAARIVARVADGRASEVYRQFTMTWDEAVAACRESEADEDA